MAEDSHKKPSDVIFLQSPTVSLGFRIADKPTKFQARVNPALHTERNFLAVFFWCLRMTLNKVTAHNDIKNLWIN